MAKYLLLWRRNEVAGPTNPTDYLKLIESQWAGIDALIKKGEVKEFGFFLDTSSGYAIGEGDGATVFKDVLMFSNFYDIEVSEILPYEKAKEIMRSNLKLQIEASKK